MSNVCIVYGNLVPKLRLPGSIQPFKGITPSQCCMRILAPAACSTAHEVLSLHPIPSSSVLELLPIYQPFSSLSCEECLQILADKKLEAIARKQFYTSLAAKKQAKKKQAKKKQLVKMPVGRKSGRTKKALFTPEQQAMWDDLAEKKKAAEDGKRCRGADGKILKAKKKPERE
eukprot:2265586-Rhodomonas_salina.1